MQRAFVRLLLLFLISFALNLHAATPVKVSQAKVVNYTKPIQVSGLIQHKTTQNLSFKITGISQHVFVNDGQTVKKGDILASLDLAEIQAEVSQASANLTLAQNELKRAQNLYNKNMLSASQLDTIKAQLQVAEANHNKAKFNLRHAQIIAPHDGVILKRLIEENELVAAGSPAFTLANQQDGWVFKSAVADKDFVHLQLQDSAKVFLSTQSNTALSAYVSELSANTNALQTYPIELKITAEPQTILHQGLITHAVITPNRSQKRILLPNTALVRAKRTAAVRQLAHYTAIDVFVVRSDSSVELRELVLDALDQDQLVILEGLEDGELVVTDGAAYLRHGQAVSIQE